MLNNLRFADDVMLIAKNSKELEGMTKELAEKSEEAGLKINMKKTKISGKGVKKNLEVEGEIILEIDEALYLGQLLSFKNRAGKELARRTKSAWGNSWRLRQIYKDKMDLKTKNKILESATLPSLCYDAQTRAVTKKQLGRIQTEQRDMERKICGIRKLEKITNKEIRKKTGGKDTGETIIKLKWRYVGHIVRDKKNKWGTKTLNWRPFGESRKKSRPATRWRDK